MTIPIEQNPDQSYPPGILDECPTGDARWWAAHTKSRREKALAHFLAVKGIGYYLPMLRKRQPSATRTRFCMAPLFNGYLFFRGDLEDRYSAYTSNHVARVIEVKNQDLLVQELRAIQTVLVSGVSVYPYDFLARGQRVRITCGPMQGLTGVIERKKANCRLVLNIETIAQAIALDLDADMVEAA